MAALLVDAVCSRFLGPLFFKKLAETKEGRQFVVREANEGLKQREERKSDNELISFFLEMKEFEKSDRWIQAQGVNLVQNRITRTRDASDIVKTSGLPHQQLGSNDDR